MGIASILLRPSVCARLEPWAGARVRSRPWGRCVECGPGSFDPCAISGPSAHARFDTLSRVGNPLPLSRSGHGLFAILWQSRNRSLARHFEIPPAGRAVTGDAARVTTPLRSLVTRAVYPRGISCARRRPGTGHSYYITSRTTRTPGSIRSADGVAVGVHYSVMSTMHWRFSQGLGRVSRRVLSQIASTRSHDAADCASLPSAHNSRLGHRPVAILPIPFVSLTQHMEFFEQSSHSVQ